MNKSKILIIGATGYIGRYIAKASLELGHPTFVLVRPSTASESSKAELLQSLQASGINIVHGSMEDYGSLVTAIKEVDIVISAVASENIMGQLSILDAIKEVGTIKRFLPSEFSNDMDKTEVVQPLKTLFETKLHIRRCTEASGVPYTFIASHCFAGYFAGNLCQLGQTSPPTDKVFIYGDAKGVLVTEEDVGTYTIKAADDPRTLNKTVLIRPPSNLLTHSELVSIWEKKIGKALQKSYVSEDDFLKQIEATRYPWNNYLCAVHSTFISGKQVSFDIGEDLEASDLYPDVKYATMEDYFERFMNMDKRCKLDLAWS